MTRVGDTLAVPFDIGLDEPVEVSATAAGALWHPGDDPRSVFGVVEERGTEEGGGEDDEPEGAEEEQDGGAARGRGRAG